MENRALLINGRPSSLIDVQDRGLQYGDGLFETLAVAGGKPCLWDRHMQRLLAGCARLALPKPDTRKLLDEVFSVIGGENRAVVKIIITRGSGGRGYRPPESVRPTRIVYRTPAPVQTDCPPGHGIVARVCATPLSINPALAGMKTLNRLEQVLARSEWSNTEVEEGLMLDPNGDLIEGTMSNLFLVRRGELVTSELNRCGIAGVMRGLVLDIADSLGIVRHEQRLRLQDLWSAEAVFITNSLMGIRPVRQITGHLFDVDAIDGRLIERVRNQGFTM